MITLLQIGHHVWNKGHSIQVNRYRTTLAQDASRGWLFKCECGKTWSR